MSADWLFIDGSSLIFRAFHGVPASVRGPDGAPINAIRGFFDALARLLTTRRPGRMAVATDVDWRPDWRVELIPSYKAHRVAEPVPPLLEPQMPVIEALLTAVGVDVAGMKDQEAEDVIATWTTQASGTVEIASGDRDLFALVEGERVRVLYPERGGLAVVDEADVARRYGIPGRSYADFAVLRGDPSDGLPGLRGVGPVAAAGLLRRHGTIDRLIESDSVSDEQRDYLRRALQVVAPARTLPLSLPSGRRDLYPQDAAHLRTLVERHDVAAPVQRAVDACNAVLAASA